MSQSLISRILFSPSIYWRKKKDALRYYPKCFKGFKNFIGTVGFTEGILGKPSIAKAQSQTYSANKSINT